MIDNSCDKVVISSETEKFIGTVPSMKCPSSTAQQMTLDVPAPRGWGKRHTQVVLSFLIMSVLFSIKVNMGIAVVAMTDKSSINSNIKIFNWNKATQDIILSTLFWGYAAMQMPAGMIAHRYGGKRPILVFLIGSGLLQFILPVVTELWDWTALLVIRVLLGILLAMAYPSLHSILGKWTTVTERGCLVTYAHVGAQFGKMYGMALSGVLAATSIGWPLIFYVFGVICTALAAAYWYLGTDSPQQHTTISDIELHYITDGLQKRTKMSKPFKTPWKRMLTSVPMWAVIFTQACNSWSFLTIMVEIPSYMKNVMGVDIKHNGLLSSLPYVAMILMSFIFSNIFDYLLKRGRITVTFARKMGNTIGMWLTAVAFLGFAFVPSSNVPLAISLLVVSVALHSGINMGFLVNLIDISPNFAATIMGLGYSFANISCILAPLTAGYILTDETDPLLWRYVFILCSIILFVGNLAFLVFATSEVQPWDKPEVEDYDNEKIAEELLNEKRVQGCQKYYRKPINDDEAGEKN